MNGEVDLLLNDINLQNALMKEVRQPGDATMDSRYMVEVAALSNKKLQKEALGSGSMGVDVDDFISKCIGFMKNGGPLGTIGVDTTSRRNRNRDEDDDDEEGDAFAWDVLGERACFPSNRRPAVPSFLLGPLSVEKRIRNTQRTARARRDPVAAQKRPEELAAEDLEKNEASNLTNLCKKIRERLLHVLSTGIEGVETEGTDDMSEQAERQLFRKHRLATNWEVSLFEFAVNPHSFAQTVENLFYVSFLVKDGYVQLGFDDNGLPTIRKLAPQHHTVMIANASSGTAEPKTTNEQYEQGTARHQAIFSLDYATWQKLIKAFDITDSMIPTREDDSTARVADRGWYG